MYAIIQPVHDSVSLNYPKVLSEALGADPIQIMIGKLKVTGPWSSGDPDWYLLQQPAKMDVVTHRTIRLINVDQARRANRHPARRPSDGRHGRVNMGPLFALGSGRAVDFGAQVHQLLAQVEWIEATQLAHQEASWRALKVGSEAVEAAMACLRAIEMTPMWKRPAREKRVEVWREKAFEVVLEGVWFTGVFDRVLVERTVDGRAVSAWVIDFKTDRTPGAVDENTAQLNFYRRVAAVLTGLPLQAVRCTLALTAGPSLVEVPSFI